MTTKQIEVILNPKIGRFLRETRKRVNVVYGGANSGKSWTIAQHLIFDKFYGEKGKRILSITKTLPQLRISALKLVTDLLKKYDLPYGINKNPSELLITNKNNEWLFKGCDDPEKLKSYECNYIWIEEASTITHGDYLRTNLCMRRATDSFNKMFLSFNPIAELHWLNKELVQGGDTEEIAICHSTYKDNPFINPVDAKQLEKLKSQDENYYRVYALGLWGSLKGIIYSNYKIIPRFPKTFDEIIYGLDFGYNNESALVEIGIKDEVPYLKELLYRTGLTTPDLIGQIDGLKIDKQAKIYGDSEDPNAIEQIYQAGYNIHPCRKGKGSVKAGIDYCKSRRLFIHQESANLIAELQSYKWREDKNGKMLEEPVKWKDHLCDAFRMALWSHRHKPFQEIVVVDL